MIPVVFVHGFMGGSKQWSAQVAALSDYSVIAIDLPGYGENAHLNAFNSIAAMASWVLDELAALGTPRFHLVGHSMGGMVAQQMVVQSPERVERLVLYGTGAQGVLPGRFETIEASKNRAQTDGAKATARRIAATWFLANDKATQFNECAELAERSSMQAILAGLEAMKCWTGIAHLSSINMPTLVVWGDQDRTYSWSQTEQLWHSIDHASLKIIPDCAHLEKPQVFNSLLVEFLAAKT